MPVWLTCFNQGAGFTDVRRSVDLPCPTIQQNGHATAALGQFFLESDFPIPDAPAELLEDEPSAASSDRS